MDTLEIVGAVIGLIYLFLEYKANAWLWPVGILMSVFYVVIFFQGKFYADAGLNVYYICANIYGLVVWTRSRRENLEGVVQELPITHTPKSIFGKLAAYTCIIWAAVYALLHFCTDSPIPMGDSFTTALSIVAMWMLAKKYVEQWLLWIVVDVVSCVLYVWKGLYPTAVLYVFYTVVATLGYLRWKKSAIAGA